MDKMYIKAFMTHRKPEKGMKYWFCSDAANAFCWTTKDEAENVGTNIKRHPIPIFSSHGTHFCSAFEIEQRASNEFVIFYEVPAAPASPEHT
jgi:hypothetical protein